MTCTITASSYLTVQPTVEILGPDGSVIVTGTGLELRTTLDPVRTSDAGEYTCRASVVIASVSVDVSGERSSTLTVDSESVVEYQYYMMHVWSFFHPVPPVHVNITANRTPPLHAGTDLTLTCTVTLDPNVDNRERVVTEWSGPGDISGDRYSVTGASGSGSTYTGSLTISPLGVQDDGKFTCTGTVTGVQSKQKSSVIISVTCESLGWK